MQWSGETTQQREKRQSDGVRRFALFPRQMVDGRWVWLEHYWSALWFGPNNRRWWVSALDRKDCIYKPPKAPPPPKR